MNGNIPLSMEIGSAYVLQVCLLQIPALVFFSAFYARFAEPEELLRHSFKYLPFLNPSL
jgi:Ca2+:H+ antiporter